MMFSVGSAYILGLVLIIGMNFCISDLDALVSSTDDGGGNQGHEAYTVLWQGTVGNKVAVFFLCIVLVAVECSNCANLASAARMVYAFSRDGALPFSSWWYYVDPTFGSPVRAIWFSLIVAFILGLYFSIHSYIFAFPFSLFYVSITFNGLNIY